MPKRATKKATVHRHWLNKKDMAKSIGLSVQAFDKWRVEPVAKVGREVFYTVDDVIDFCVERALKKNGGNNNLLGKSFDEAMKDAETNYIQRAELLKVEKIALETQRMKLQNAVLEGRSLPAWAVTEVLTKILSRVGEIFDSLALKIHRKHPNIDKRVIELVKNEVIKAQNEAAHVGDYTDEIIENVIAEAEEKVR